MIGCLKFEVRDVTFAWLGSRKETQRRDPKDVKTGGQNFANFAPLFASLRETAAQKIWNFEVYDHV